jgi:formate C-acetyltransferase
MQELITALKNDFSGHEKLQLYLTHRLPKWGNGNPEADLIAKNLVSRYCAYVNRIENNRGGKFVPSMFSLTLRYSLGKYTSALPNGRKKGEPLSQNNAASPGMDKEGVTALLKSYTNLNYLNIQNGSVSDVCLHPSAIKGDDGLNAFVSLIKTYFKLGGFAIQFNIFDRETLLDAQKHPEKYQTMQIRVCGWNVYFVTMSPYEQQQYINMNIHAV